MHLAQEPLTNVQCSGGLRSFYKGDESLEDENSGWPSDIHNDQLRASSKLIVLKLHEKLYKNSASNILRSFGTWSKWEKWKSSISECLNSWPQIKSIFFLKCLLLFYATTMNHFSFRLWCAMKRGFYYDNQWCLAQWLDREEAPKYFRKQTCTQKRSWFGDMLPVSSTIAFCVHAKLLQSCLTLCDPVDCITPDSSVHCILQAWILGWFARPSSRGSSWPREWI